MKKKSILIIFLAGTLVASAIKVVDDIITRLGMEQKFVQGNIVSNLVGRFSSGPMESYDDAEGQQATFRLPYIPAPKLLTIITGDKAGAAKELCEYVKKYINSEEFINEYTTQRESAIPLLDKGAGIATLKGNKIVFEKNINNYKTDTKYVAEQQKLLEENQVRLDALLEAAKKPFPGKALWEAKYPADPSVLVKKRLEEYLQLAAAVDFNAALTAPDKYKIKKFVNPALEKKSNKWKAIYRAGKEVNDVVTAFVKEWLKGEIISANKIKMTNSAISNPATTATSNGNSAETISIANTNSKTEEAEKIDSTKSNPQPAKTKKSLLNRARGKIGF